MDKKGKKTGAVGIVELLPEAQGWAAVQRVRSMFDKRFMRWPPHLTLLSNVRWFEPDRLEMLGVIKSYLEEYSGPRKVVFGRVEVFKHRKTSTVVLLPTDASEMESMTSLVDEITDRVRKAGFCGETGYSGAATGAAEAELKNPEDKESESIPHITLGSFVSEDLRDSLLIYLKSMFALEPAVIELNALTMYEKTYEKVIDAPDFPEIQIALAKHRIPFADRKFEISLDPIAYSWKLVHLNPQLIQVSLNGNPWIREESCASIKELSVGFSYSKLYGCWIPVVGDALEQKDDKKDKFSIVSYNVLSKESFSKDEAFDFGMSEEKRVELLVAGLKNLPTIVALQEVSTRFLRLLLSHEFFRSNYYCSDCEYGYTLTDPVNPCEDEFAQIIFSTRRMSKTSVVHFSEKKRFVVTTIHFEGRDILLANVHLSSSMHAGSEVRLSQIQQLRDFFSKVAEKVNDLVCLGDFNLSEGEFGAELLIEAGFTDAFLSALGKPGTDLTKEKGFTYNPLKNTLAKRTSRLGTCARYDRIYFLSSECYLDKFEVLQNVTLSDHYPIVASLSVGLDCKDSVLEEKKSVDFSGTLTSKSFDTTYWSTLMSQNFNPVESSGMNEALDILRNIILEFLVTIEAEVEVTKDVFRVVGVGSYATDTLFKDSDLDCICLSNLSRGTFEPKFTKFLKMKPRISFEGHVSDALAPVWRLTINGVKVEMMYAQIRKVPINVWFNPYSLDGTYLKETDTKSVTSLGALLELNMLKQTVKNWDLFSQALKVVKLWARNKQIYGMSLGLIGGACLNVMVAYVLMKFPTSRLSEFISTFFEFFARFDYETSVISLKAGNEKLYQRGTDEKFIVLTNFRPIRNIIRHMTPHTFDLVRKAFLEARSTVRVEDLVKPIDFEHEYSSFLVVQVASLTLYELKRWQNYVKSRIVNLVTIIQKHCPAVICHPWNDFVECSDESFPCRVNLIVGLKKSSDKAAAASKSSFDLAISEFCDSLSRSAIKSEEMFFSIKHKGKLKFPLKHPSYEFDVETSSTSFVAEEKSVTMPMEMPSDSSPEYKELAGGDYEGGDTSSKKGGMRTEKDVYYRIKWDSLLDSRSFYIGYLNVDPILKVKLVHEVPYDDFPYEDVPKHNIRYFKYKTVIVWDRENKIDNFFGSVTRTQAAEGVKRKTIQEIIKNYK